MKVCRNPGYLAAIKDGCADLLTKNPNNVDIPQWITTTKKWQSIKIEVILALDEVLKES